MLRFLSVKVLEESPELSESSSPKMYVLLPDVDCRVSADWPSRQFHWRFSTKALAEHGEGIVQTRNRKMMGYNDCSKSHANEGALRASR
jgi:hypothetical protein